MPESYRRVLEPNTTPIWERLIAVDHFQVNGYEVHLNFSPVIVYHNWLEHYRELFRQIDQYVTFKENVKAEVIFLTHNEEKHKYNLANNIPGEYLLWQPEIQESKVSQYGGDNIRYKHDLKAQYIKAWTDLHDEIIPWNKIRYIF